MDLERRELKRVADTPRRHVRAGDQGVAELKLRMPALLILDEMSYLPLDQVAQLSSPARLQSLHGAASSSPATSPPAGEAPSSMPRSLLPSSSTACSTTRP